MKQSDKHRLAFEAYYRLRNDSAVSREIGVSRQSVGKWKVEFNWDDECADRDHEVDQRTKEVMVPVWVDVKVELVRAFITQINDAMDAGITIENPREMVAVSKELRALLGEADRSDDDELRGIVYVLTESKEKKT